MPTAITHNHYCPNCNRTTGYTLTDKTNDDGTIFSCPSCNKEITVKKEVVEQLLRRSNSEQKLR